MSASVEVVTQQCEVEEGILRSLSPRNLSIYLWSLSAWHTHPEPYEDLGLALDWLSALLTVTYLGLCFLGWLAMSITTGPSVFQILKSCCWSHHF